MSSYNLNQVKVLPPVKLPYINGEGLPPLTLQYPQWSRGSKMGVETHAKPSSGPNENLGETHVKMNKKVVPELAAIGRSEGLMVTHSSDPLLRVTQLEQNIRFLQDQHTIMLSSLFQEVEQLRQKNRDLQFQLVFNSGGVSLIQSSPTSSPEDNPRPKILLSPKQFNLTPLQVEILERDITDLKATLHEAKTKNLYLSGIVEEQKKKLDKNEEELKKLEAVGRHISPIPKVVSQELAGPSSLETESESIGSADELAIKLEEAEQLIRRLRRENDDQKRELITIKTNLSKSLGGGGGGGGGGRHLGGGSNSRGGGGTHHQHHHQHHRTNSVPQPTQTHRFPPLHTQSYWHHGGQQTHRGGLEWAASNRRGANDSNGFEKENQLVGRTAPSLPNLRGATPSSFSYGNTIHANTNNSSTNLGNSHQQRRGGYYNGNHYYRGSKDEGEGGNRKYRGGRGGTRGTRESKE